MQDGDESDSTAAKHSHDEAQEGDHDQNMEGSSLAEETRMAHKKLRSLFKEMRKDKENQLAALADELKQGPIEPQAYMQEIIAQSIPPHLRHQFTLATVACIRRFERDTDQQMVENVTETMRELLRKPPRAQPCSIRTTRGQALRISGGCF